MKKLLALVLAVVMVLSGSISAFAEGTPTIRFETEAFTQEGEVKEVKLVASDIGLVSMVQIKIVYDATKLELQDVDASLFSGMTVNKKTPGKINLVWDTENEDEIVDLNGTIVTFTFKAISSELGETKIGFDESAELIFMYVDPDSQDMEEIVVEPDEESGEVVIDYKHDHTFGDWKETKAATCKDPGEETQYCTAYNGTCDETATRATEINPNNHVDEEPVVKGAKDPTCYETGYTGDKHCAGCDALLEKGSEIGTTDHVFGDWKETVPATCKDRGEERRDCTDPKCDKFETRKTPVNPNNHVDEEPVIVGAKEPTCTEYGYTGDKSCLGCGVTLEKGTRIDMKPHTGGVANCESGKICDVCKNEYGEKDPANHVDKEPVIKNFKEASCVEGYSGDKYCAGCDALLEKGSATPAIGEHAGGTATCTDKALCDGCGNAYGELNPQNHGNHKTENRNAKEATCTEKGYSGDEYCLGCGELAKAGNETPMKPHTGGVANCLYPAKCDVCKGYYGNENPNNHVGKSVLVGEKEATCTEKGYTGDWLCGCEELLEKGSETKELGHDMGAWKVTKEPTCTEKGTKVRECQRNGCDHSEEDFIETISHKGGEADCVNKAICEMCKQPYGETDPTKHKLVEDVIKEPTCTEKGEVLYVCTVDGCNHEETKYPEALGHKMGGWVVVKEPEGYEDGIERRDCERCDYYEERKISNILDLDPTVIINMNGKNEQETNPNTGAPAFGMAAIVALGACAAFFKRKR